MTKTDSYYPELRENLLKFIDRLKVIDNPFLVKFSKWVQNCYKEDRFIQKLKNNPQIITLDWFLSNIFFLPLYLKTSQTKGCALLGETPFDKLELVTMFLENYNFIKYDKKSNIKNCFVVVDCQGKFKKYSTLLNLAIKYRNIPFVIFNNCENILNHEENLELFRYLIDENRKVNIEKQDEDIEFTIKSMYILLGSENKMNQILENTPLDLRQGVAYRISSFNVFIHIVDF